jgi:hypothetical protein
LGGTGTLSVRTLDTAGNSTTGTGHGYTLDQSAPTAPAISGISPDAGTSSTDGITDVATVSVSGTAEANSTITLYDGATLVGTVTADGTGAWTASGITLNQGANSLTATATDAAGNTGSASSAFTGTLDTTAPTVASVTDDTTSPNVSAGVPVTLTLQFSENVTASAGTTLQLSDGGTATYAGGSGTGTLTFTYTPGAPATGVTVTGLATGALTDIAGNTATGFGETICFMPGTRVATPLGEIAVETLKIGDLVTTADGHTAPVRWIGRQTISRVFADPLRVLPIRIQAGALGESLPARDLLISADHAILLEGVLVQAGALVNGSSIRRETDVPVNFTYYHVELDDHSLILAEGVPAETFIDNIDRLAFDNWDEHEALYPEGRAMRELPYARAQARRQVPQHIRKRLAERTAALFDQGASTAA